MTAVNWPHTTHTIVPTTLSPPGIVSTTSLYPPYNPIPPFDPPGYSFDRQLLTADELEQLARKVVTLFPPGETLVLVVEAYWSDEQLRQFQVMFDHLDDHRKVFILRKPRKMELVRQKKVASRTERIDLLARIGIVWEENPGLSLRMILDTMFGINREGDDESVVSALELAWE